jgi:hypothetical protein
LFLKRNPSSGDEGNRRESQGEGLFGRIAKREIEEDGIRPIIIIAGEEDLIHLGEGNV